jgi:hypothetical protein
MGRPVFVVERQSLVLEWVATGPLARDGDLILYSTHRCEVAGRQNSQNVPQ